MKHWTCVLRHLKGPSCVLGASIALGAQIAEEMAKTVLRWGLRCVCSHFIYLFLSWMSPTVRQLCPLNRKGINYSKPTSSGTWRRHSLRIVTGWWAGPKVVYCPTPSPPTVPRTKCTMVMDKIGDFSGRCNQWYMLHCKTGCFLRNGHKQSVFRHET